MQTDMHYYGVYVLARLAGLNHETAKTIADASEYTDHATHEEVKDHPKGAKLIPETTAHHAVDTKNLDLDDQRKIWVPFHFLPGNEGKTFHERLICRKDSALAQEMLRHYLSNSGRPWAAELMGVSAHVYADTFSHYGFSGISSPLNSVKHGTLEFSIKKKTISDYVKKKAESFEEKYGGETEQASFFDLVASGFAAGITGALGHAGAYTYPDRPYMVWHFKYESWKDVSEIQKHDNPATFMEGAQKLHSFFRAFQVSRPDLSDPQAAMDFGAIQQDIIDLMLFEGKKEQRIKKWQDFFATVAKDRKLKEAKNQKKPIPAFDADKWDKMRDDFHLLTSAGEMAAKPVYRFFQAASFHRHYVLRELLPSYGLVVY